MADRVVGDDLLHLIAALVPFGRRDAGAVAETQLIRHGGAVRERTCLAGLVAAGEYPDMFYSDNLKKVPKERFKKSWWFRKEFAASPQSSQSHFWLYFKGINYRANIFLNGKRIADDKTVVGAYRDFEL